MSNDYFQRDTHVARVNDNGKSGNHPTTHSYPTIQGKQMSTVTTVAKAVAAELNRHSGFYIPFQAAYSVKPSFDLEELHTIRVVVVPKSYEIANITRASSKYIATVDVGIMQRIGRLTPEDAESKPAKSQEKTQGVNSMNRYVFSNDFRTLRHTLITNRQRGVITLIKWLCPVILIKKTGHSACKCFVLLRKEQGGTIYTSCHFISDRLECQWFWQNIF